MKISKHQKQHWKSTNMFQLMIIVLVLISNPIGSLGLLSPSSSFIGQRGLVPANNNVILSRRSSLLQMAVPTVNDWKILKGGELVGAVQNHPTIENGDVIRTSPLANADKVAERGTGTVQTISGSKYKLGTPSTAQRKIIEKAKASSGSNNKIEIKGKQKKDYKLTGKVIGNKSYLLAGKSIRSTSGKSSIVTCYQSDIDGEPVGEALCAKLSSNLDSLRREAKNYEKVTRGLTRGKFVSYKKFYERANAEDKSFGKQGAIVIEQGMMDCKSYLERNGALEGKELRNACLCAVECLQAVHSANLVWTDLKPENFVVTSTNPLVIKGIDLESAMPTKDNPVDYSPEACPPEFAESFLAGTGPYFVLQKNYDIWSLGMMFYELATGKAFFGNKSPSQITKLLKSPTFEPDTSKVSKDSLRSLIDSCLQVDPRKRPSLTQVSLHPYFITTGIGPFSF